MKKNYQNKIVLWNKASLLNCVEKNKERKYENKCQYKHKKIKKKTLSKHTQINFTKVGVRLIHIKKVKILFL